MNRPQITITEAIRSAVLYANIENDEPFCASALYEEGSFALVIYTFYQKYEFYVDSRSGEVLGILSEPMFDLPEEEGAVLCA